MDKVRDEEEHEDENENRYCFCNEKGFGHMVGCENDDCKYRWFHAGCLHMRKVLVEDEVWYCPECREKAEIKGKIEKLHRERQAAERARSNNTPALKEFSDIA